MTEFQLSKLKDVTYIIVTLVGLILSVAGAYFSITAKLSYLNDRVASIEHQHRAHSERTNLCFEKLYSLQYEFGIFKAKTESQLERRQ